jgi:hypothetical protein
MTIRDLLGMLRRANVRRPAKAHAAPPDAKQRERDAKEESLLGPDGPLGPTGGQVGNPQRF